MPQNELVALSTENPIVHVGGHLCWRKSGCGRNQSGLIEADGRRELANSNYNPEPRFLPRPDGLLPTTDKELFSVGEAIERFVKHTGSAQSQQKMRLPSCGPEPQTKQPMVART